jgi:riboflavin synthase
MFTGIIQSLGRVESNRGGCLRLKTGLKRIAVGASVAVNGACLTVVRGSRQVVLRSGSPGRVTRAQGRTETLEFDLSPETLRLTNLKRLRPGDFVNLETSLRLGDGLDGHLASGHVDAEAKILKVESLQDGCVCLRVALPWALRKLVPVKGSISVNGVSLTVTRLGRGQETRPSPRPARNTAGSRNWFETVLVPYTLRATNLGSRKAGDLVNLEVDLIARYVKSVLYAKP